MYRTENRFASHWKLPNYLGCISNHVFFLKTNVSQRGKQSKQAQNYCPSSQTTRTLVRETSWTSCWTYKLDTTQFNKQVQFKSIQFVYTTSPVANNKKNVGMLNFRVYFPLKLFAAAGLIADCRSPLKQNVGHINRQKKQIRLSAQNLKSKKLRGKQTQQLQKSLGALKIVNNSGSQFDWGKLKTKVQFKISQSNCLIAVNS